MASHGDTVYVLNALGGGRLQGYKLLFGRFLVELPGSGRSLGLDPAASPQFSHTPGQVSFTPDGRQVVTTKANGSDIDVFGVRPGGWLSAHPVVNAEPGTVPFAITFSSGHLVIAEAGTNALATFILSASGRVSLISQVGTGAAATCWVAPAGPFLFAGNAGSATESGFTASPGGQLNLLGAASTDPGTVDASATAGGQFLYVRPAGTDRRRVQRGRQWLTHQARLGHHARRGRRRRDSGPLTAPASGTVAAR